jgi:hypothetical protein
MNAKETVVKMYILDWSGKEQGSIMNTYEEASGCIATVDS